MKLSEAIFIFERYEGGDSLIFLNEFDRFELTAYLLKSKNEVFTAKNQERAEMLLKVKLAEYGREIERANKFIELLDIQFDNEPLDKIEGMNETLKYLTELSLYLASIGIDYNNVSVYEAHRLYAISYKNKKTED